MAETSPNITEDKKPEAPAKKSKYPYTVYAKNVGHPSDKIKNKPVHRLGTTVKFNAVGEFVITKELDLAELKSCVNLQIVDKPA